MITLDDKEKEMIVISLNMRRNYIETGDISVSAKDLSNMDTSYLRLRGKEPKVNALSTEQMQLIINMENLIKRIYGS